jgi:hypothetical protein
METLSLTWDNSATTRVEWNVLGWLIRKASGGLPYPKGVTAVWGAVSIGRFLSWSCCDGFWDEGFLYCPLLAETIAGFLKLVELCKGLVVGPYLISSLDMNGKSRSLGKWVTLCWGPLSFEGPWKSPRGGGGIGKSEIYKLKHTLQAGLALELNVSPKEMAKTNHKRIRAGDMVICFTEVRFLQTYSPLRLS